MAKKSRIEREKSLGLAILASVERRKDLSKKLVVLEKQKRETSDEKVAISLGKEIFSIMNHLQRTRSRSYIRARNRCQVTGRTRGYLGAFGMSRGTVRHLAAFGLLNGVKKSSHS